MALLVRLITAALVGTCALWPALARAQISPPGLGPAEVAAWSALGFRQDLDARERRQAVTYIGVGAISDPGEGNPFHKPAILVINQEVFDRFRPRWRASLAGSYRRQNLYDAEAPYEREQPAFKTELRLYARLSQLLRAPRFELSNTLRPELRSFVGHGLEAEEERFEFRLRAKAQITLDLDAHKAHRIVAGAEVLSAVARDRARVWSRFRYHESRFTLYYSLHPSNTPVVFDIGYMNDLLGRGAALDDVHYLAIDVVWTNPFGSPKRAES